LDLAITKTCYERLPLPTLALQNMATVLQAVDLLQNRLPVSQHSIAKAMETVKLPGRIQILPGMSRVLLMFRIIPRCGILAAQLKHYLVMAKRAPYFPCWRIKILRVPCSLLKIG